MAAHGEVEDQRAHVYVDFGLRLEAGQAGTARLLDIDQMAQDVYAVVLARQLVREQFHLDDAGVGGTGVPHREPNGGHFG